jgi:hypothetical protein
VVARGLVRLAQQVGALVEPVERSLDDSGILAPLDLRLELVARRAPAISTSVGTQSSDAKIWFLTVPDSMCPGQRITIGARMPPSQVVNLPPANGVTPPSG